MTTSLDRLPVTRRRLLQASGIAFAASQVPFWSAATHAQGESETELVAGNTGFALDLYHQLREESEGNLLVSPYSVSLALAMAWAGAAGETATQMAATLGFEGDPDEVAVTFSDLSADMAERGTAEEDADEGVSARGLIIANAIWGEETVPFNQVYLDLLDAEFDAPLRPVDFQGDPDAARDEINDWVADQTNDRIEDIVPEDAITTDTRLVLTNAVWFSGAWQSTFTPENTEDGDFTLLDGSTVTAPFMRQTAGYNYATGNGWQAVELPYEGSGFAFLVVLPESGEFETVEASLDSDVVGDIVGDLTDTQVELHLPRFTFDYSADLVTGLEALGMTDAFTGQADFSGMIEGDPEEQLAISGVLHKAFIDLNEDGTEAAAATAVVMGATSAPMEDEPIELLVDRPFIFAIRDTDSGTILFLGRVLDPGK